MQISRWRLAGLLFIPAAILLSGCVTRSAATAESERTALSSSAPGPTSAPESVYHTVEFRLGEVSLSMQAVEDGALPDVPGDVEGARLVGWIDYTGAAVQPNAPVTEDAVFFALTRPALKADSGWLLPRENGLLVPEDAFTFGDARAALDTLLADPDALAWLTAGWAGRDAEPLSPEDLSALLESLFSPEEAAAVFEETFPAGDETVTRARAAACLARLLGAPVRENYYPDAMPSHWAYDALGASAAPGVLTREGLISRTQDGYLWFDGYLYYLTEEGFFLSDETLNGLYFNAGGRFTSGSAELDSFVAQTLRQYTLEEQTRLEKLRSVYLHVKNDFTYRVGNFHDSGAVGWEIEEALTLYRGGKGNCYCYAGVFWSLARGLGYNAVTYSGSVGLENQPHAWTEITLEGEVYICDPELEMNWWWVGSMRGDNSFYVDLFMMPRRTAGGWNYQAVGRT